MLPAPAVRRPEILAPAGTEESFAAALASGADAIYLGLAEGFNARERSTAFTLEGLPELVRRAHSAGAKLYLTLNTLIFERELEQLEQLLGRVGDSGVDALIVQDPATAFLAQRVAPDVRLHASTQMTISSAEGARFAQTLGIERVVLPRELSAREVALFTAASPLESEVFVHGALCMAWSGQCLTSEAFSERSANRGQCSQACRMPYKAIVDGQEVPLGDQRYLLSPQDLAAHEALPQLLQAGVHSLKIEGRYKGPAYVTTAVDSWRSWRDALLRGVTPADQERLARDRQRTQLTFSRGGSVGFLRGDDHQQLVVATTPKHRGLALGTVIALRDRRVLIQLDAEPATQALLRPGLGVKFEPVGRRDAEHEPDNAPGGPVFGVRSPRPDQVELSFGEPGPDLRRVRPGDAVRVTSDPELARDAERRLAQLPSGRLPLRLHVTARRGAPLSVNAAAVAPHKPLTASATTSSSLQGARDAQGLTQALLHDKLGALGGTAFYLEQLDVEHLDPGLHVPVSELKQLRRHLVAELTQALERPPTPRVAPSGVTAALRDELAPLRDELAPLRDELAALRDELSVGNAASEIAPTLVALCRTEEQLEAVIASAPPDGAEVELDWMEMVGLTRAVRRARDAGLKVTLATVRVQKPGEEAYDRRIANLAPDGVLVRHWGALMHFSAQRSTSNAAPLELHGDFSLNVTNSLTAHHLLRQGLHTVTASHDLNKAQLLDLLARVPRGRVAVTLHHHIPTFHNSHCVYAHLLSDGADYRSCGRPCEQHRLALRDYAGHEHPVVVDVSCRNTVFNALAQSAAPLVPQLLELGVRRYRVEFVWERADEVQRTLAAYRDLLRGHISPAAALRAASVHERYGVTTLSRARSAPPLG